VQAPLIQLLFPVHFSAKLLLQLAQLAFLLGLADCLLHLLRVESCTQQHLLVGSLNLEFKHIVTS
jgi:hypothetical protein